MTPFHAELIAKAASNISVQTLKVAFREALKGTDEEWLIPILSDCVDNAYCLGHCDGAISTCNSMVEKLNS